MTRLLALRTTLLTSFTLLLCSSIVDAQDSDATAGENRTVLLDELNSIATSINELSAEKKVDESSKAKPSQATKQPDSTMPQARPGERVTNPDHEILNSDTKLGGVAITGTSPTDFGYLGPGDMRTHLWNGHASELINSGITENKLMAMTVAEVQKWHNHFHGAEGSPDHPHDDGEHGNVDTIVQHSTMPLSPTYVDDAFNGTFIGETIVYEDFEYDSSGYPQSDYGQSEIIYEQGFIVEGYAP